MSLVINQIDPAMTYTITPVEVPGLCSNCNAQGEWNVESIHTGADEFSVQRRLCSNDLKMLQAIIDKSNQDNAAKAATKAVAASVQSPAIATVASTDSVVNG